MATEQTEQREKHPYNAAPGATMFWGPWNERRPDEIGDLTETTLCYPLWKEHHGKWTSFYMEVKKPGEQVTHFWLVRDPFHKTWVGNYGDRPQKKRASGRGRVR